MRRLSWVFATALCLGFTTPASAETVTVGPTGTYATLQQGVDALAAALSSSTQTQFILVSGSLSGPTTIDIPAGAKLSVTGGWNDTFSSRAGFSSLTASTNQRILDVTIGDGGALTLGHLNVFGANLLDGYGSALHLVSQGDVVIHDTTFQNNQCTNVGPVYLDSTGAGSVELTNVTTRNNSVNNLNSTTANGAGAYIYHQGSGPFAADGLLVFNNTTQGQNSNGGGLYFYASHPDTVVDIRNSEVFNNTMTGSSQAGGAAYVRIHQAASVYVSMNVYNNTATSQASLTGGASYNFGDIGSRVVVDDGEYYGNTATAHSSLPQLHIYFSATGNVDADIYNNRVSDGSGHGITLDQATGTYTARVLHNTFVSLGSRSVLVSEATDVIVQNNLRADAGEPLFSNVAADQTVNVDNPTIDINLLDNDFRMPAGHPLIDTGACFQSGPVVDVDGRSRPQGCGCEPGAFEVPNAEGCPTADAGNPGDNDAGTQPDDAGSNPSDDDAGTQPDDAGSQPDDAGSGPDDAGTQPDDAGPQPDDAGPQPDDAGSGPDDDAGTQPDDAGANPGDDDAGTGEPVDGGGQEPEPSVSPEPGPGDDVDDACACAKTPSSGAASGFAIVVLVALLRRRRR